jgi:glycosyltransferase involved in cell wall biosynthesis
MKILMIAPEPFFEPRGTPISVYQRLSALSSLGYQVDLVTYHVGENVDINNVTIHRIMRIPYVQHVKVGPSFAKPLLDLFLLFKSFMMMIFHRYDLLHTHEEAAFIGVFLSKIFRTPHIYDMHSSLPHQLVNFKYGWRMLIWLFTGLERWVLMNSTAIITVGEDLEVLVKNINPSANVSTIENIPLLFEDIEVTESKVEDLQRTLAIQSSQPVVVYTGTFEAYQGIDLILDSAKRLVPSYPNIRFILVGGRPDQVAHWKTKALELEVKDFIIFTGIVSPHEAACYMHLASILVSPRIKGTSVPLKIYSYLSASKPIIATSVPAHTQVLNNEVALLVDPNPEALAEGIAELIRNDELRDQLSRNAKVLADKKHNTTWYLRKLESIYPQFSLTNIESIV